MSNTNRIKSKKYRKRLSGKRARKWISGVARDSMRAGRRGWGLGVAK